MQSVKINLLLEPNNKISKQPLDAATFGTEYLKPNTNEWSNQAMASTVVCCHVVTWQAITFLSKQQLKVVKHLQSITVAEAALTPGDRSWGLLLSKTFFGLGHCFVFCLVPKIFLLVSTSTLPSSICPYYSCPELFMYCYFIHLFPLKPFTFLSVRNMYQLWTCSTEQA